MTGPIGQAFCSLVEDRLAERPPPATGPSARDDMRSIARSCATSTSRSRATTIPMKLRHLREAVTAVVANETAVTDSAKSRSRGRYNAALIYRGCVGLAPPRFTFKTDCAQAFTNAANASILDLYIQCHVADSSDFLSWFESKNEVISIEAQY